MAACWVCVNRIIPPPRNCDVVVLLVFLFFAISASRSTELLPLQRDGHKEVAEAADLPSFHSGTHALGVGLRRSVAMAKSIRPRRALRSA